MNRVPHLDQLEDARVRSYRAALGRKSKALDRAQIAALKMFGPKPTEVYINQWRKQQRIIAETVEYCATLYLLNPNIRDCFDAEWEKYKQERAVKRGVEVVE